MASSRTILIAGAGIGGLATALALAQQSFRVVVFEQAERLQEVGAGLQLSPNATRGLFALGLRDRLLPHVVAPQDISIKSGRSGREIGRIPLGAPIDFRYGTPYWVMLRADLQRVLLDAVQDNPDIALRLGVRVEDFAVHAHGVTAELRRGIHAENDRGIALVGADGLWSTLRVRLGDDAQPQFSGRTAWRATVPAEAVREDFRAPVVHLWLRRHAHLVHYPVAGGRRINIVAIVEDTARSRDWSGEGRREDLLRRIGAERWYYPARLMLEAPERWQTWSLFERRRSRLGAPSWSRGPVTLLGDAAHPMLPFLAQGAAMAIEDAMTLAQALAAPHVAPAEAIRRYEGMRRGRTARVQRAARRAGRIYHLGGPQAWLRNLAMGMMGREKLRERFDWLYDWRQI